MLYVIVKGTLGHAGVEVEGLDCLVPKREEVYRSIVESLGFTLEEGGIITKKPGSYGKCDPVTCGERILTLEPFMYPTDVLNKLREAGFKIITSAALPTGAIVWTLELH